MGHFSKTSKIGHVRHFIKTNSLIFFFFLKSRGVPENHKKDRKGKLVLKRN